MFNLRAVMASPKITEEKLLDHIADVFRAYGYEGASLNHIAKATGLKRASLYHRFPGGKEEMATAVLQRTARQFDSYILAPLSESITLSQRITRMAERLDEFFHGGRRSCLLDTLSFETRI